MDLTLSSTRAAAALAATVALVGLGVGGAAAISGDDDAGERQIRGDDLERAERAALRETGGGRVTAIEVGDEESKYEVEVTLDDGSRVDVQLDSDFEVVGSESDGDGGADDAGDD